ncbi:GT-D fold domain-containing glycosyltransferase [Pectobacterium polaris]|uniref:GT-D fold domain-containing glycosyltransferase n=1 Tax=Pectobacterium polaris TaxID=2042057 RepID=UPI002B23F891|nr:GT-D fold domain-containing glycosyltransferase [Pectobacterium polaris]
MGIRKLVRNLIYLKKVNLKEKLDHDFTISLIESLKYELADDLKELNIPKIETVDETINTLLEKRASICRFGDGELNLICHKSIPFQTSSPELSRRLIEVLSSDHAQTLIAIPRACYYSKKNLTDINKNFWRSSEVLFRRTIEEYIDFRKRYFSAEITLAYSYYKEYDYNDYFEKIRNIWKNKDVKIICGETIFDKIEKNIFDCAKSIEYQYAPSLNAFESYNNILEKAKETDTSKVIIIILGPTAKILAYDLSHLGYQALDLGHIAKSYDWYKKEKEIKNIDDAFNFFDPD